MTNCPDCEVEGGFGTLVVICSFDTDWYGRLTYYRCTYCKEEFVQQDDREIDIPAP
jgi:hypothetical protein